MADVRSGLGLGCRKAVKVLLVEIRLAGRGGFLAFLYPMVCLAIPSDVRTNVFPGNGGCDRRNLGSHFRLRLDQSPPKYRIK